MGSLRERNRLLVVDALRRRGLASRSDLARTTGLSRTTVGSVVAGLQQQGLVDHGQIVGAGVALPGPVDRHTGTIGSAVILPGWAGLHAQRELARRLGLHVEVDNDANLGALAEASFGAGRGLENIVYVMLGSGIGAGLVLDGRVHRGAAGLAGELGHVQVRTDGAVCRCGNRGCLETVASGPALLTVLRAAHGEQLTVAGMLELAASGDLGTQRVINDAGRAIGHALGDLCNSLN